MEFMVWSRYVNIDDCWANWNRTADGKLAPNSTRFPSGMKALADYVESKGLKLGTCKLAPCICGRLHGRALPLPLLAGSTGGPSLIAGVWASLFLRQ